MRTSVERILTTHVGRLQRPEDITAAMEDDPRGRPTDLDFGTRLSIAVADVVQEQKNAGIDIVCDGEFGKLSWNTYINGRLGGHEIIPLKAGESDAPIRRERIEFQEFFADLERNGSYYYRSPGQDHPEGTRWACVGPVTYIGHEALRQDLKILRAAADEANVDDVFVPSTSPIRPGLNVSYANEEAYFAAVGEAMRIEYKAIVDAGFVLQIDDPHLPDLWGAYQMAMSVQDYRKQAERYVEIINHALRGIPEDRIRYHICWGSWHGPHVFDLPLANVVDVLLKVHAGAYVFEAANAQHDHEWQLWQDIDLPEGKILIPGVIGHATNVVEHPDLVALRIRNFADAVGRERVIAGTDCGLGYRVHPQIAWAKLNALVAGAEIASRSLWGR